MAIRKTIIAGGRPSNCTAGRNDTTGHAALAQVLPTHCREALKSKQLPTPGGWRFFGVETSQLAPNYQH
jgi:hypothetical protein